MKKSVLPCFWNGILWPSVFILGETNSIVTENSTQTGLRGEKFIGLCKLDQDRCGFRNGSTQDFNNVKTQFLCFSCLVLLPLCWLYSLALPEQKITLTPSAPKTLQGDLYPERCDHLFPRRPSKSLTASYWLRLACSVATGM